MTLAATVLDVVSGEQTVAEIVAKLESAAAGRGHPSFRVIISDGFDDTGARELLGLASTLMARYPYVRIERLYLGRGTGPWQIATTYRCQPSWAELAGMSAAAGTECPWEVYAWLRGRRPRVRRWLRRRTKAEVRRLEHDGPRSVNGDAEICIGAWAGEQAGRDYICGRQGHNTGFLMPVTRSAISRTLVHEFAHALEAALERLGEGRLSKARSAMESRVVGRVSSEVFGRYGASSEVEMFAEAFVLGHMAADPQIAAWFEPLLEMLDQV